MTLDDCVSQLAVIWWKYVTVHWKLARVALQTATAHVEYYLPLALSALFWH